MRLYISLLEERMSAAFELGKGEKFLVEQFWTKSGRKFGQFLAELLEKFGKKFVQPLP